MLLRQFLSVFVAGSISLLYVNAGWSFKCVFFVWLISNIALSVVILHPEVCRLSRHARNTGLRAPIDSHPNGSFYYGLKCFGKMERINYAYSTVKAVMSSVT